MWKENRKSLSRSFDFNNFIEAFAFVNKVGLIASNREHYPKICIEKNTVDVKLSTEKIGGFVTQKDHEMAMEIESAYGNKEVLKKSA